MSWVPASSNRSGSSSVIVDLPKSDISLQKKSKLRFWQNPIRTLQEDAIVKVVKEVKEILNTVDRNISFSKVYWFNFMVDGRDDDIIGIRLPSGTGPIPLTDQAERIEGASWFSKVVESTSSGGETITKTPSKMIYNPNNKCLAYQVVPGKTIKHSRKTINTHIHLHALYFTGSYSTVNLDFWRAQPTLFKTNDIACQHFVITREFWFNAMKNLQRRDDISEEIKQELGNCSQAIAYYDEIIDEKKAIVNSTTFTASQKIFSQRLYGLLVNAFKEVRALEGYYNFMRTLDKDEENPDVICYVVGILTIQLHAEKIDLQACADFSDWNSKKIAKLNF